MEVTLLLLLPLSAAQSAPLIFSSFSESKCQTQAGGGRRRPTTAIPHKTQEGTCSFLHGAFELSLGSKITLPLGYTDILMGIECKFHTAPCKPKWS